MSFGFGFGFPRNYVAALFTPGQLFTTGVNGAWYDPSDITTLFQDAAGTTPVTAVEQPVGLMLDKSGRGNHALNNSGNSANFPVLSARYNLLTKTEQFDDAVWGGASSSGTVTKGTTTGIRPDGTTGTIHTLTLPAVNVGGRGFLYQSSGQTLLNIQATFAIYARVASGSATVYTYAEDIVAAPAPGNFFASSAHSLTTEWKRLPLTGTRTSVSGNTCVAIGFDTRANAAHINASPITIEIWGADLRVANDALNQPQYQRVGNVSVTPSDYDTVGFKPYLRFNGTNQWLQTNSIDFTATDKMFVSAGVRKNVQTSGSIVCETSSNSDTTDGAFEAAVDVGYPSAQYKTAYYMSHYRSTLAVRGVDNASLASPHTSVFTTVHNLNGVNATEMSMRLNRVLQTFTRNEFTSGTGNFGNYPLYIGSRAGTTGWLNGRLYGLVVAGKQASASEITNTETFINQKTGAY